MDKFKLSLEMEPTEKYEKAKQDLLQALKSYGDLSPTEKESLMKEFFGVANFAAVCNMLKQYFGWGWD